MANDAHLWPNFTFRLFQWTGLPGPVVDLGFATQWCRTKNGFCPLSGCHSGSSLICHGAGVGEGVWRDIRHVIVTEEEGAGSVFIALLCC